MDIIKYKKRLVDFNTSLKYKNELHFLARLIHIQKGQNILDYGCGIGTAIDFLKEKYNVSVKGYDKYQLYLSSKKPEWFIDKVVGFYDCIYFLHSLAHIKNIDEVLIDLKAHLTNEGKIVIITPNKSFDDFFKKNKKDYKYSPDKTVFKHYYGYELESLIINNGYRIIINGQFGKVVDYNIYERLFLVCQK